jgi:hypothetical protein
MSGAERLDTQRKEQRALTSMATPPEVVEEAQSQNQK